MWGLPSASSHFQSGVKVILIPLIAALVSSSSVMIKTSESDNSSAALSRPLISRSLVWGDEMSQATSINCSALRFLFTTKSTARFWRSFQKYNSSAWSKEARRKSSRMTRVSAALPRFSEKRQPIELLNPVSTE